MGPRKPVIKRELVCKREPVFMQEPVFMRLQCTLNSAPRIHGGTRARRGRTERGQR
jgi:hypothetical protein